MKKFCGIILMLPLLLSAGALRITDSSRGGSSALRNAALEYSLTNGIDIRIDRMSAKQADMLIPQKTVDIAVYEMNDIPAELAMAPRIFMGAEVLLLYVHHTNEVSQITSKEAAEIFTSLRPRWSRYGGNARTIHRLNLRNTSEHAGLDRDLFNAPAAAEVLGVNASSDVVHLVSSDPEALGFAHFSPADEQVKILKVDGIFPTSSNIMNGRYPLARRYVLVVVKKSQDAEKFVDFLKKDIKNRVRNDMWLLPEESSLRHSIDKNTNFKKEK